MKSDKIKEFAVNVHFLSFKKGGKIQTGLNCEYDGLSEACLSLSHSSKHFFFNLKDEIKINNIFIKSKERNRFLEI